jgi:hypothetical protein
MRCYVLKKAALHAAILTVLVMAVACGGGGGGGPRSSNEPGDLSLWLEKGSVDSGDLCRARVDIYNPNPAGVILKFRLPTSIRYSTNSAVLFPDEEDQRRIIPSFEATKDGFRYIVFFLSDAEIRYGDYSTLELNLKADRADPNALVAVDLDNNDPNIPDSREFNAKQPQFASVEELGLEILGEPGPTRTPGPARTPGATSTPGATRTPSATGTPSTTPTNQAGQA